MNPNVFASRNSRYPQWQWNAPSLIHYWQKESVPVWLLCIDLQCCTWYFGWALHKLSLRKSKIRWERSQGRHTVSLGRIHICVQIESQNSVNLLAPQIHLHTHTHTHMQEVNLNAMHSWFSIKIFHVMRNRSKWHFKSRKTQLYLNRKSMHHSGVTDCWP